MKLAVVGAGYWGVNLIRVFNRMKVLGYICDFNVQRLNFLAKDYPDVPAESSYDVVLSDQSVDAIVIATPAETHYGLAKQALLAGKDVFVEKPMTLRADETEELTQLAESRAQILMVGHFLEYHPALPACRN